MDEADLEIALEELADEAPRLPFLLAGGFGHVAGLLLRGLRHEVRMGRLSDGGRHMRITLG